MGLKAVVARAALAAFTAAGDLVTSSTYTQVTPGAYDPATDAQADVVVTFTIEMGVLAREKTRETDNKVLSQRTQFIVPALLMEVVPQVTDRILIKGELYEVNDIKYTPGDPIYTFFIRAT